jgi:hypothetical protein
MAVPELATPRFEDVNSVGHGWQRASSHNPKQRVFAHRQHQPPCQADSWAAAQGNAEVVDDRLQPQRYAMFYLIALNKWATPNGTSRGNRLDKRDCAYMVRRSWRPNEAGTAYIGDLLVFVNAAKKIE